MKNDKKDVELKGVASAKKADKAVKLRCIIYPRDGGSPYYEDVEPEKGTFTLEDSNLTYQIARGSVWKEPDGVYRVVVNEGNPQTIHPATLMGDDAITPESLHGVMWNNLWHQYDDATRRASGWARVGMWSIGIFAVLLLGVLVWAIFSISGDLESIRHALEQLDLNAAPRGGGGQSPAAQAAGHQNIAPGEV